MSFLLNSRDLEDQKISDLLMKNTLNNEAPTTFKKKTRIDNGEIKKLIDRSKKKKCTICPFNFSLSSSVQSTINTLNSISQRENSKLNKFLKDLSLSNSSKRNDIGKNIHTTRLTKPKSDDMKFLYKIFYNYKAESTIKMTSLNLIKETNEDENKKEIKYDKKILRNYVIKIQTEFNEGGDVLIVKRNKNIPFLIDYYIMRKLEDLIARYSLIIFLYLKMKNYIEAKKLFLLMIQENMHYFNYIEDKIVYTFTTKDKNNKTQSKENYRMIQQLLKIYSFIIRYSQLFNTINKRNKFMGKYFRLMNLNYHYLLNLANIHGFNYEIKHQLIYWYSFYLSYVNYFSILNYFSCNIPITINNIILSLYKNLEERLLNNLENRQYIETIYNQGLLLYINDQKDEALFNLKQAEEKMKLMEIRNKKYKKEQVQPNRKVSNNSLKNVTYFDVKEKKKKLSYKSKMPINLWKKIKINEQNGYLSEKAVNLMKSMRTVRSGYSNYLYDEIEIISKNFSKSDVKLSDISLLIEYGIEIGKLNNKDIGDINTALFTLFKKSESNLNNGPRKSQIIYSRSKNHQDFQFPQYLTDPLFFKIELLINEIEINKKNIKEAFDYTLKLIFLLILLKFAKTNDSQLEYIKIQNIIIKYLNLIDDLCEEKFLESNINSNDSFINSNGQLNLNLNSNNEIYNFQEIKKNTNEETLIKEFEKFFIFLSCLSVYQIKVLNETQPPTKKRNDLPIFFSTQFKDCLSTFQRLQLDELQTMVLSRFTILKNPNRWIIPSNLNNNILNCINTKNSVQSKPTLNFMTNMKGLKIYSLKKHKIEYNNYKRILLSKKITPKIKEFLNKNIHQVLKILKNSSEEEIKYLVTNPLLLVHPIKRYKKKFGKNFKINHYNESMIIFDNIDNGTSIMSAPLLDIRKSTKPITERIDINTRLSNADIIVNRLKFSNGKKGSTYSHRRRNKSTGNFMIKPNIIDEINQCSFINDPKGTKDYNDSFEDYKLTIESPFNNS